MCNPHPRHWLAVAAALLFATAATAPAAVSPITYAVSIDTTAFAADADDQPFAFAVQLNSGGAPGVANSVTLDRFAFGTNGSAGDASTISLLGSAAGSLSTAVTLDTTASGGFNYFQQDFTPGGTLTFRLTTSTNGVDPTVAVPDALAVQLLDAAGQPVPTTDPDTSDSLLTITYDRPIEASAFGGDPTRTTTAGRTLAFAAPTVSAVPEPSCLALAAVGSALVLGRRRARPAADRGTRWPPVRSVGRQPG